MQRYIDWRMIEQTFSSTSNSTPNIGQAL